MNTNFAIKDCIDLEVTVLGQPSPVMTIDYLNSCSFTITADSIQAKKKGTPAITFAGAKTGELTLSSELTNIQALGMQLGGVVTGEKIAITSVVPATHYTLTGTFRTVNESGEEKVRKITFHKCKPKVDAEVTFDSENVATFDLKFDLMVDSSDKFITVDVPSAVLSTSATK